MQRRNALGLLAAGAAALHAQSKPARERIVGVYRLARVVRRTADGQETVANANPVGRISYDKSGRVVAMIFPPNRRAAKDPRNVTFEEYKEIETGMLAYFGTYEVDEANRKLVIKIEAGANPAITNTTIERAFVLTDTHLTMTVPGNPSTDNVFERLPD